MEPAQTGLAPELFWMAAATVLTGLLWVPYILNRLVEHGLWRALSNPAPDVAPRAPWAGRLMAAHANAVENLVLFAPLAIAVVIAERTSALTATATCVYFAARAAHALIYAFGVPVLRTLAFATGWGACAALAAALAGLV